MLNLNYQVSNLTSSPSPFSAFSGRRIQDLFMDNASLPSTFLVDFPDFFVGLQGGVGIPGLTILSLRDNGIVDLNADRLNELLPLAFLDVSENELTSFDICSVREPENLQVLYISGNKISHYDNFDGCRDTLRSVVMHRNQLTYLSAYSLISQSIGGSIELSSTFVFVTSTTHKITPTQHNNTNRCRVRRKSYRICRSACISRLVSKSYNPFSE